VLSRNSSADPREAEVREALMAICINTAVWTAKGRVRDREERHARPNLKKELVRIVERVALSVDSVEEVHDVKVRSYGGMYYVDMKIHVDPDLSVEEAHRVAERVEETVKKALGSGRVVEVLIHYEPTTPHN